MRKSTQTTTLGKKMGYSDQIKKERIQSSARRGLPFADRTDNGDLGRNGILVCK
jgi:hypothetical protein